MLALKSCSATSRVGSMWRNKSSKTFSFFFNLSLECSKAPSVPRTIRARHGYVEEATEFAKLFSGFCASSPFPTFLSCIVREATHSSVECERQSPRGRDGIPTEILPSAGYRRSSTSLRPFALLPKVDDRVPSLNDWKAFDSRACNIFSSTSSLPEI